MAKIFITGSADGLGQLVAAALIKLDHKVLLHARSESRGLEALDKLKGATGVVAGDLSSIAQTVELAEKVNASGVFDAIIHNAGVYQASAKEIFHVNVLAPYILTCLVQKPKRLIYLSSDMHLHGHWQPDFLMNSNPRMSYSDSKLMVVMLSNAIARKRPEVYSNAINPGWVPTRMGGRGAPDDLQKGAETQTWLSVSKEAGAMVSGRYFFHKKEARPHPDAGNIDFQERLLDLCAAATGIHFPG